MLPAENTATNTPPELIAQLQENVKDDFIHHFEIESIVSNHAYGERSNQ